MGIAQLNSHIFRQSVLVFAGTVCSQAIVLGMMFYLARVYAPAQFGVFGSYQALVGIFWVLCTLRYELAFPVLKTDTSKQDLMFSIFVLSGIVASSVTLLVLFIKPILLKYFGNIGDFTSYYLLIGVGIFLVSISSALEYYAISERLFSQIAIAKITQAVCMSLIHLVLSYINVTAISLIIGYLIGYAASAFVYWHRLSFPVQFTSLSSLKLKVAGTLNKHLDYPKLGFPSALANFASTNLPILLMGVLFTASQAGNFFFAQRLIGAPVDLITSSISQVFLGTGKGMIEKGRTEIEATFWRVIRLTAMIGLIPFLLLFLFSKQLVGIGFGEKWVMAGEMISLLTFMYYARFITVPLSHMLNLLKALKVQFAWDVLRLSSLIILFAIGYYTTVPLARFVLGFSILMGGLYFLHAYLGYRRLLAVVSK